MATVADVLKVLESLAPASYAFDFDRVGLQVGDPRADVRRAVVSLDRSLAAARFAAAQDAQLLLSHHPLLFRPIEFVGPIGHVGSTIFELIERRIAFVAAHTNWDCAPGGVNDVLAAKLGLEGVTPFGSSSEVERLKLVVTTPAADAEAIIEAASRAGAGRIGLYSRCAFMGEGIGTFYSEAGSNPTVGQPGSQERVEEVRIEMTLDESSRRGVEESIRNAHPYEEPAIDFYRLTTGYGYPAGRIGSLRARSLAELVRYVESALSTKAWAWGDPNAPVAKVAVVGGAADGEWRSAQEAGADVLITGEVKQHIALEAVESDFPLVAAGHYATEQPGCERLRDTLAAEMPEVDWILFEPEPGSAGRPL